MRANTRKHEPAPSERPAETPPEQLAFVRWVQQLETDLAESVGSVVLRGARVAQIEAGRRPTTAGGALVGYAIRNTSSSASATVRLVDGADDAGDLVVPLELAAGESVRDWFGPGGLNLSNGLYVDVAAGEVEGAVYLRGPE